MARSPLPSPAVLFALATGLAALAGSLFLRLPVVLIVGLGHPIYRIPTDEASRRRVAPANLPDIVLERIPFGSGKESEGPEWRSIPLR